MSSYYRFGLVVEDFRQSKVLSRLSRKLLNRNITQLKRLTSFSPLPKKNTVLSPFSCTHTPNFPDILAQLDCTLLLSTYQAGKVILLSAKADGLVQLPRTFKKPMGIAVNEHRLTVATQEEVIVLANARICTGDGALW
ncbi:DUF4915 domain-containing protein [Candidatus Parabeggiatoa sp. HSG14]|uniref:DUF4915 domain-containing protein n=1 Tax=Candidatus Parabeggiatoa sp. HSG14 TaxID=3055593 RepID=UPI0025A6F6D8|nr:DUF4915 domain-containing protein [Thiotrichales bacterium HSG14]